MDYYEECKPPRYLTPERMGEIRDMSGPIRERSPELGEEWDGISAIDDEDLHDLIDHVDDLRLYVRQLARLAANTERLAPSMRALIIKAERSTEGP